MYIYINTHNPQSFTALQTNLVKVKVKLGNNEDDCQKKVKDHTTFKGL